MRQSGFAARMSRPASGAVIQTSRVHQYVACAAALTDRGAQPYRAVRIREKTDCTAPSAMGAAKQRHRGPPLRRIVVACNPDDFAPGSSRRYSACGFSVAGMQYNRAANVQAERSRDRGALTRLTGMGRIRWRVASLAEFSAATQAIRGAPAVDDTGVLKHDFIQ
jgi:phage terminase large subunit-like protein